MDARSSPPHWITCFGSALQVEVHKIAEIDGSCPFITWLDSDTSLAAG